MSARYELRDPGVFDTERGVHLLAGDDGWPDYERWLAQGSAPAPDSRKAPPITLDFAIAERLAQVEAKAAEQRFKVTGPASGQEMASWSIKRDQALAYQAKPGDLVAPLLAAEAAARGVATADIVKRVLANADAYARAEAQIAGTAGRHKDAIRSLRTPGEVLGYDASAGWPL